jgi:RHS repeat-associated protein
MSVYEKSSTVNTNHLTQAEVHLYGSSRLGVFEVKRDVENLLAANPYNNITTFERGNKFFELTNHLGNVLVTISDRKLMNTADATCRTGTAPDKLFITIRHPQPIYLARREINFLPGFESFVNDNFSTEVNPVLPYCIVENPDNITQAIYFEADVVTANDYYPFGMTMPGRKYSAANSYRYGFNGKENDNEVKGEGNQQDYGMRIYDGRLGKFLSVDPLTKEYPWNSTYAFAENDVIRSIDLEGAEKFVRTHYYTISNGKTVETVTDDVWAQKADISIHPLGTPQTDKKIAAHNAITYQVKPKTPNGTFVYFEFDPALGKSNYAKYMYNDARGYPQVQYFTQADMQYRFEEIEQAKKELNKDYNLVAALTNLAAAGWLVKAEMKGASAELKAASQDSKPVLASWSELEDRARTSNNPLSLETSTNGKVFRAVVQNIESAYGDNIFKALSDINKQAVASGASKLEIRGIEITNPDLNRIFNKANGKSMMGYNVEYSKGKDGYGTVNLTKEINK